MYATGNTVVWEKLHDQKYVLYFYLIEEGKEFGYAEQNATNEPFQFNSKYDYICYDAEDLRLIAASLETIAKL